MFGISDSIQALWIFVFVSICAVFFLPLRSKGQVAAWLAFGNAVISTWISVPALWGQVQEFSIQAGSFLGEISVRIDALSAWFILIINFTVVTGAFYGTGYLKAYKNQSSAKVSMHWILYLLFHQSMVWVCMLQHGFAFLLAWEIMSLSSMLLVIFDHHDPKIIKAGVNYLVQMHLSVVFLTIGFIWAYFLTGSFNFSSMENAFHSKEAIWLFLMFFLGFGLKAGFVPLHTWLPHAHPSAPSHVSGVMSGVIVKLGIYGILRMISFLSRDFLLLGECVVTLSIVTGLYGILNASVHRDFKQMLAYCTIENIGIIGIGIGVGLMGMGNGSSLMYFLGFGGALMHVLNHSLFKSLLFYSAGSVYQQIHTRDMEKSGGLIRKMPKTALLFLIGSLAVTGLPPFNGFISEFIIYAGLMSGLHSESLSEVILLVLTFGGLSLIGGISILTFSKAFGTIFLGRERMIHEHAPEEVSSRMLIPQYAIVGVMLSVAFFPVFYLKWMLNILGSFSNTMKVPDLSGFIQYSHIAGVVSLCSALFIVIVLLFLAIRYYVARPVNQPVRPTWGCSYVGSADKMQYTGKSFSKSLSKVFNFLLVEKKQFNALHEGEIFPTKRKYVSYYVDFFEHGLLNPVIQGLLYAANYFKFIQNGRMQSYVLYGIIFIFTFLVLSILNILK